VHSLDGPGVAARPPPPGIVPDGEVIVAHEHRVDFGQLQRRLITSPGQLAGSASRRPVVTRPTDSATRPRL